MASGHGVSKPDKASHPSRQVGRETFPPPTGPRLKPRITPPGEGVWQRTEQGGWVPAKRSRMSKPNPGGYSPDEISNIMRNSGP